MRIAFGAFYAALGVAIFIWGFVTEWRQSRESGPIAIVATLPMAVVSAILLSIAVGVAPLGVPWWAVCLLFPVLTVALGKLILMADGRKRDR